MMAPVAYTPNPGFTGLDSFEYTIKDNDGAISNSAMVTIMVNPACRRWPKMMKPQPMKEKASPLMS